MNQNFLKSNSENLVKALEPTFKKLPHLPKSIVKVLVAIAPWLALIGGIAGVLSTLFTFIGSRQLYGFMGSWGINPFYLQLSLICTLISSIVAIIAFKDLKAEKYQGWLYLLWISLLSIAVNVIGVLFYPGSIIGMLISAAISLYILFEIKAWYK